VIFYKNGEDGDPFYHIYSSASWLRDYDPVAAFPQIVDIELTNHCNFDCLFCQRRLSKAPKGRMNFDVFRAIVDECAEHSCPIRIAGWGEPLIHKRVDEYIAYASSVGVVTKIYTNGSLLTRELMVRLIDAGLGELQFSLQGLTPAQYEENRRLGDSGKLAANIAMAAEIKRAHGGRGPYLSVVTSVLRSELEEASVDEFRDEWFQHVDKVAIDMTNLHFVGSDDAVKPLLGEHLIEKVHSPCVDVFLKIHIAWDGTLDICSQDAHHYPEYGLGSVGEINIQEAWTSERFERHRDMVGRSLGHDQFRLCRNCYVTTGKYDHLKDRVAKEG
jgi:pyruvate-formate lyase-activating enzyme